MLLQATDLVCDVLANHTAAWEVFENHGICADCKHNPPPVPIQHFVDMHCDGRIDEFLHELNSAISV